MKALILRNHPAVKASAKLTVASITRNIQRTYPECQVDVCSHADGEKVPDVSGYDLLILTGGTVNLLEDEKPEWVVSVLQLIRDIEKDGKKKLLGFCWGHQAIHYATGGKLAWLEDGPRIGVQEIKLTSEGQKLFGDSVLNLHKYHKRVVSEPAADFTLLAENNEISMSKAKNILTFQGHPELTTEIFKALVSGDDGSYKPGLNSDPNIILKDSSTSPHDGEKVWDRIMKNWVPGV